MHLFLELLMSFVHYCLKSPSTMIVIIFKSNQNLRYFNDFNKKLNNGFIYFI